jgi:hypothetical protein
VHVKYSSGAKHNSHRTTLIQYLDQLGSQFNPDAPATYTIFSIMSIVKDDKPREYKCKSCGKSFARNPYLRRHIRHGVCKPEAEKPEPHRCHLCGKGFTTKGSRDAHVKQGVCKPESEKSEPYKCHLCGKYFRTKATRDVHVKQKACRPESERLRLHTCDLCGKGFHTKGKRDTHVEQGACKPEAEKPRPHKCHLCGMAFTSTYTRNKHVATGVCQKNKDIPKQEEKYKCKFCGKGFSGSNSSSLRRHERTCQDKNVRTYKCPLCGRGFRQQAGRDRHIKTGACKDVKDRPERECECDRCGKLFYFKWERDIHQKCTTCKTGPRTERKRIGDEWNGNAHSLDSDGSDTEKIPAMEELPPPEDSAATEIPPERRRTGLESKPPITENVAPCQSCFENFFQCDEAKPQCKVCKKLGCECVPQRTGATRGREQPKSPERTKAKQVEQMSTREPHIKPVSRHVKRQEYAEEVAPYVPHPDHAASPIEEGRPKFLFDYDFEPHRSMALRLTRNIDPGLGDGLAEPHRLRIYIADARRLMYQEWQQLSENLDGVDFNEDEPDPRKASISAWGDIIQTLKDKLRQIDSVKDSVDSLPQRLNPRSLLGWNSMPQRILSCQTE